MISFLFNRRNRILNHVFFWVFIFALFAFLYGYRSGNYMGKIELQLKFAIFEIGITYFTLYFLLPKLLLRKKLGLFTLVFVVALFASLVLENLAMMIPKHISKFSFDFLLRSISTSSFFWLALENIFVILLASSIKLLKIWYSNQKEKNDLEKRNLESELELLKSQINPHFLFNTLNNINTLVFIDQQKTYNSILKLSELLRYMIYETRVPKVFLKDEINYLANYIELQRLRFKNHEFIDFQVLGDAGGIRIAPMLFIPFIENAFKYCKRNIHELPGISIKFEIANNQVDFKVWNYTKLLNNIKTESRGGLGIENTRKRLQLVYPENHGLTIENKEKFSVHLIIEYQKNEYN